MATLAGHSFPHEIDYAFNHDIFGSIDANRGDPQLGWDTDQFPIDLRDTAIALYIILQNGGFKTGGFNFDTKLRRQSIDLEDLFYGHISGIDTLAHALLIAENMINRNVLGSFVDQRYQKWNDDFARQILDSKLNFEKMSDYVLESALEPKPVSGRQEMLENFVNDCFSL